RINIVSIATNDMIDNSYGVPVLGATNSHMKIQKTYQQWIECNSISTTKRSEGSHETYVTRDPFLVFFLRIADTQYYRMKKGCPCRTASSVLYCNRQFDYLILNAFFTLGT